MKLNSQQEQRLHSIIYIGLIFLGAAVRLWRFGSLPGGINQDEAFAGYTAFSLLNWGLDTSGYAFPVYLTAWGSGMNALNTYLMIPFVALFGLKVWVIRLPQLIIGLLSMPALYALCKKLFNERTALFALMLLALCPWHIMLCRWGLESNLAPGFLLFGLFFFVKSFDDRRFLPVSALLYGLSLYTYATIWPFVPLMLLLMGTYTIYTKRLKIDGVFILSVLLLALLALPLLLFLLINYDVLDEIRLPFLSIPKLLYMRSGELSLKEIPHNFKNLLALLFKQTDGLPWNSTKSGLLYFISTPFVIIGIVRLFKKVRSEGSVIVLIHLFAALLLGLLIDVNVNRVNIIFIPLIICAAVGLDYICEKLTRHCLYAVLAVYIGFFAAFGTYYFGEYQPMISYYFAGGLESAVEELSDFDGEVYVTDRIYYPSLMFYDKTDVKLFLDTVEYKYYPAAYLSAKSFGKYTFFDETPLFEKGKAYILPRGTYMEEYQTADFEISVHQNFITLK